jgi:NTP pyrophosphatase (non-canonical NTP hydrolase)
MNKPLPLSFPLLRLANVRRCEQVFHPLDEWSITDWATAMAGECGEACNEVKKLRRLDGADASQDKPQARDRLREKIAHELADLVIYADLLAARLGIDLGDAVVEKFNEVSAKRDSTVRL